MTLFGGNLTATARGVAFLEAEFHGFACTHGRSEL